MVPRSDNEYVGLDFTDQMHRDLCRCMSGMMRRIEIIWMHWDDASNKTVGTEGKVEIDVRG